MIGTTGKRDIIFLTFYHLKKSRHNHMVEVQMREYNTCFAGNSLRRLFPYQFLINASLTCLYTGFFTCSRKLLKLSKGPFVAKRLMSHAGTVPPGLTCNMYSILTWLFGNGSINHLLLDCGTRTIFLFSGK